MRINVQADNGKKGLMLWATVIPIGVIFCPYALYETACVHETDASWKTLELHWRHTWNETDFPDGFTREGILLRGLNPACPSTPSLLLTSARAHALGTDGLMSRWPCASVQIAFLVVLLIDIIIPAGEHAAELNMPPPVPLNSVSISTTPMPAGTTDSAAIKIQSRVRGLSARRQKSAAADHAKPSTSLAPEQSAAAIYLEHGTLHIHLIDAGGLKAADKNGLSDPYVKLSLGGRRAKSKTIKETLNPKFDERFQFSGVRGELLSHELHLSVWDWDWGARDDKLGTASLDLEPLLRESERAYDVQLSEQGRVRLKLSWSAQQSRLLAAPNDLEAGPASSKATTKSQRLSADAIPEEGTLCVHLLRGEALKATDANGLSDPLVKLSIGGQNFSSKTVRKTVNPRWNQQFRFEGFRGELTSRLLELTVLDYDNLASSDMLGFAAVDLNPLLGSKHRLEKVALVSGRKGRAHSSSGGSKGFGHLHLVLTWEGKEEEGFERQVRQVLSRAATFIVDPLGFGDPMGTPEEHRGKEWAERQYYVGRRRKPNHDRCELLSDFGGSRLPNPCPCADDHRRRSARGRLH